MDEQSVRVRAITTREPEDFPSSPGARGEDLADLLPAAVVRLDAEGVIAQVNAAWRRDVALGGATAAGGLGRRYDAVLRGHGAPEVIARVRGVAKGCGPWAGVFPWHDEGAERWVSVEASPLAGAGAVVEHRDVTAAQQAQRRAAVRARVEARAGRLDRDEGALRWLCELMDWSLAAVWRGDRATGELSLAAVVTRSGGAARAWSVIRMGEGASVEAWRAGEVRWAEPAERGARAMLREALRDRADAVRATLAIPTPEGAIAFYAPHRRRPERALEALLANVAEELPAAARAPGAARRLSLRDAVGLAAMSASPLLLTGEAYAGKGTLAWEIHHRSTRAAGPLVQVDGRDPAFLARLAGELRREGGAQELLPGALARARGGTLVIKHVDALDDASQSWLREALERGSYRRVGDASPQPLDARVIACTRTELPTLCASARFDALLLDRLTVQHVEVPPLRARADEVVDLAQGILDTLARAWGVAPPTLRPDAVDALLHRRWPGNLRELRALLERAWGGVGAEITAGALAEAEARGACAEASARAGWGDGEGTPAPEGVALSAHERALVERALRQSGYRVARAARVLGISRSALYARIRGWGIDLDAMRASLR